MRALVGGICLCSGLLGGLALGSGAAEAKPSKRVCVDVQIKTFRMEPAPRRPVAPVTRPPGPAPSPPDPRLRPAPGGGAPAGQPGGAPAGQPGGAPAGQPGGTPAGQPGGTSPKPAGGEVTGPRAPSWQNPFVKIRLLRAGSAPGASAAGAPPVQASEEAAPSRGHRARQRPRAIPRDRYRYPYPPAAYLKRLVEHFVTHEEGYEAVSEGCSERLQIELYPLQRGWTAFARYSRRAQEEKVDVVHYEELPRFAERVVRALLFGKDIATTADLRTILGADSIRRYRTIKGMHYFTFAIGTAIRVASLPTYQPDAGEVRSSLRDMEPLAIALGYRARFNEWGLDLAARGGVGLQRLSLRADSLGRHARHVDLGGLFDITLHFLRYHRPHGMISLYYGGGAMFDLTVLESILPATSSQDRERIVGGGLNIDAVLGFEFMRASGAQFFIQLTLSAPTWLFDSQTPYSDRIRTWMPEASVAVGLML